MSKPEPFENPAQTWRCGNEMRMSELVLIDKDIYIGVDSVRKLHKRIVGPCDNYVCDHCTDLYGDTADFIPYPCPTIKALEGE